MTRGQAEQAYATAPREVRDAVFAQFLIYNKTGERGLKSFFQMLDEQGVTTVEQLAAFRA